MAKRVSRRAKRTSGSKKSRLISHDTFFKRIFRRVKVAQAFLRAMLRTEAVALLDLDALEVLPTDFLTRRFQNLHCDVIYRVPQKDSQVLLHFYVILEHKSRNEYGAVFQVVRYGFQLVSEIVDAAEKEGVFTTQYRIPIVLPIIIYHGKTQFSGPTNVNEYFQKFAGYEEQGFSQEVTVLDMSTIPDDDLPQDPLCPELHASMKLMKYIFRENFIEKFQELLESLLPYTGLEYEEINHLMWHYALGRATHATLPQFQRVFKKLPNQNVEENEMPGLLQRERIAGRKEGQVNSILLFLSQLGEVPQPLKERLYAIALKNTARLNELLLLAPKCKTIEEFEKALLNE